MGNLNGVDCSHDEMVAALCLHNLIKKNAVSDVVFDTLVEAARHECLARVTKLFQNCYDQHKTDNDEKLGIALLETDNEATNIIRSCCEDAQKIMVAK